MILASFVSMAAFGQDPASEGSGEEPATLQEAEAPADAEPAAEPGETDAAEPAPARPVEAEATRTEDPRSSGRSSVRDTGAGVEYDLRLRELEDRMGDLKEEIFRSRSRLFLLREQILQQGVRGSRLVVNQVNEMNRSFRITSAVYALDGNLLLNASEESAGRARSFPVFEGVALPGAHNLSVEVRMQGNPRGIFRYMEGYEFTVRSSHQFLVEEGQTVKIDVVVADGARTAESLAERPSIRYDVELTVTTLDEDAVSATDGSNP